ncbi:MAG: hypothetical protein ACXAC5_03190 [Promethearchaeota archaeon]
MLRIELRAFDIFKSANGYRLKVGDEYITSLGLNGCLHTLDSGIQEIREHMWESWQDIAALSQRMVRQTGKNSGSLDNLLFLNSTKRAFQLSTSFTDLEDVQKALERLMDSDILHADDHLILHFNTECISVQSLHRLIMTELYRKQLITRLMRMTKQAQISGPWANLDLPMKERIWEWDDGEDEYFDSRRKARREQIRYNPEDATKNGFYYVWQDLIRDPYRFEDMRKDSPYKSRYLITVP